MFLFLEETRNWESVHLRGRKRLSKGKLANYKMTLPLPERESKRNRSLVCTWYGWSRYDAQTQAKLLQTLYYGMGRNKPKVLALRYSAFEGVHFGTTCPEVRCLVFPHYRMCVFPTLGSMSLRFAPLIILLRQSAFLGFSRIK